MTSDLADARIDHPGTGSGPRKVLAGAAAAWLTTHVLLILFALTIGASNADSPPLIGIVAGLLAVFGGFTGAACVLFSPVAGVLALAGRSIRGAGAVACVLVGAAGAIAVDAVWYGLTPSSAAVSAGVGAVAGLAGWFASSWVACSSVRVLGLVIAAAGLWLVPLLSVL